MKTTIKNSFRIKNKVVATMAVVLVLLILIISMVAYVYERSAKNCYEELDNQTSKLKTDLIMRMDSDSRQLKTISNFAENIYNSEEMIHIMSVINEKDMSDSELQVVQNEMTTVFNSFTESGLIDNLELLIPGDKLVTANGIYDVSGSISFEETAARGEHISSVRTSVISKNKKVIYNAVPVIVDGKTVAVLMGVVDVAKLNITYKNFLNYDHAHMHLVDTRTGEFILSTADNGVANIKDVDIVSSNKNEFVDSIFSGKRGQMSFESGHEGFMFVSYDFVKDNNWCIVVAMEEETAFAEARSTIGTMVLLAILLIVVMTIYIMLYFYYEKLRFRLSNAASMVRKLLLEFGKRDESLTEALELITNVLNAESAFFVDSDNEHYVYKTDKWNASFESNSVKNRFVSLLMEYSKDRKNEIYAKTLKLDNELADSNPELYSIMASCDIKSVVFTAIADNNNNNTGIIGTINSTRLADASGLMCDVAMCFMMTVYNRKYLNETEQAAVTDPLTGLNNRMAFNRDGIGIKNRKSPNIAAIYIDVNELHTFNNKYGHVAGDNMLIYISGAIVDSFAENKIYRWGGDEFIVIAENTTKESLVSKIEEVHRKCEAEGYHVSVGYAYSERYSDLEALLKEAEKRMYEAKARYYQDKSNRNASSKLQASNVSHISTGSSDIDAALTVMSLRYQGVYVVSLNTDEARAIVVPEDVEGLQHLNDSFKKSVAVYVDKYVSPDYYRPITNFMNYDGIKEMLKKNILPRLQYKKLDGTEVNLSIYPVDNGKPDDTIWVFEKKQ